MWLLKFHIAFSILCLLTVYGFAIMFREQIKKNGWTNRENKKPSIRVAEVSFIPILNVFQVITVFIMIGMTRDEFEKLRKK